MSSLRQILESRRAAHGALSAELCHTTEAQPACLVVATAGGETWVFPWAQLAVAHYAATDHRESLTLVFTSHEVRLVGVNLGALRDLVARLQLARVQPAPSKYEKTDAKPFCESVQVRPLPHQVAGRQSSSD